MLLSLKVIGYQGMPPTDELMASFGDHGGTIGRAESNDFVLADPEKYISRHHAEIRYQDNHYILTDTSLSGTYIDDNNTPAQNSTVELHDGMRLLIGEYQILVSLTETKPAETRSVKQDSISKQPEAEYDERSMPETEPYPNSVGTVVENEPDALSDSVFDKLQENKPDSDPFGGTESVSTLHDNFVPPQMQQPMEQTPEIPDDFKVEDLFDEAIGAGSSGTGGVVPSAKKELPPVADYDKGESNSEEFVVPPIENDASNKNSPPAKRRSSKKNSTSGTAVSSRETFTASTDQSAETLLKAFLDSAGLKDTDIFKGRSAEQTIGLIGTIFREMVDGLMAVLRGRAELKSEFRLAVTTIRPAQNNPLKFSPSVDDALQALLTSHVRGFLEPVEAIQDSFDDIMNHQLAMTAGIQAALTELLRRFDPVQFEKQFKEGIVFQKNAKCWDAYVKAYPRIADLAAEEFFGNEFARAYEEQMQMLKSIRE